MNFGEQLTYGLASFQPLETRLVSICFQYVDAPTTRPSYM